MLNIQSKTCNKDQIKTIINKLTMYKMMFVTGYNSTEDAKFTAFSST